MIECFSETGRVAKLRERIVRRNEADGFHVGALSNDSSNTFRLVERGFLPQINREVERIVPTGAE